MKQKFTFEIDEKKGRLTLSESAEADPGTFLKLHFEEYVLEEMKEAAAKGPDAFIEILRRKNLFPSYALAEKLFEAFGSFVADGGEKFVMDYDDIDTFPSLEEEEAEDDEDVELDELLTTDDNDLSEDDIKEIDSEDDTPKFRVDDNSEQEN
ncbi:MAG: hypothetical protein GY737_13775 [Desulfobacteraceae bacterium]|nr:hypothetical protein [Desulfobacteraceae bacterium]